MTFWKDGSHVHSSHAGVKLKLFCPEAKNSSPLFKFIELWGADLIESRAILVEVNFYHSLSSQLKSVNDIKNRPWFTSRIWADIWLAEQEISTVSFPLRVACPVSCWRRVYGVCILMNNGVEVFWRWCITMYVLSAVCMDRYAWSTRLLSWFLLS
jgi:hypothetical protein